jgi:zinc protease
MSTSGNTLFRPPQASLLSAGPLYSAPAQPLPKNTQSKDIQPIQTIVLSNGAQANLQQRVNTRRSHLDIVLPIGPTYNGPRTLLPRMLVAGSAQTKTLLEQAAQQGIQTTVSAEGDVLMLKLSAPSEQDERMLTLAMTLLTKPVIDPVLFQAERDDLLKNMTQALALPEVRLSDQLTQSLYGANHPYAETYPRIMQQLQVQTPNTLKQVLAQALAQPAGVRVQWISALPVTTQTHLLNQSIQGSQWTSRALTPLSSSPPVTNTPKQPFVLLADNTLERAHMQVVWPAPNVTDPDYPAFLVLLNVLDGFNGRFFQQLRTRQGLVYSTRQSYENYRQAAEYRLNTEVDFENIQPALSGINKVLLGDLSQPGLLTHLVNDRDLLRAKKAFILKTRSAIQTAEGLANFNTPMLLANQPPVLPADLITQIEAVTTRDVYRVAQRVFGPGNSRITGITAPQTVIKDLQAKLAVQ